MDLSALIFVALAVAWAVYLVPKALKHHEDVARTRSVDRFSHTMRVLARREPTSRSSARLVVPGKPAAVVTPVASTPAQLRAGREAARLAARRRLRVVSVILVANLVVAVLAATSVVAWPYVAIPAGLLVAWLVTCRLMVKRERAASPTLRLPLVVEEPSEVDGPVTEEIVAVTEETVAVERPRDPDAWDLVPVTLPTYVTKEPATRRTVRTIDLDSTGVWTSGRTEIDSAIARGAEEAERVAKASRKDDETRRATGS
ncbi:hypothetical protein NPS01_43070 [Nocardioides psychrotolerans]|uniref:Uncharacterized protein n=1 Tax=Nocardioides psychrotolerans TaxID=1005945 RepID=A0A1I3RRT0_9ACTN|nr:hypothetical protein [Nocardioides psychrotolerans]GEP40644.1 hypothetical protein NPS01_43070 [Nocardioides psychrotolerans]SFJ48389.1 hypothetical protein SAMN05216561_13515 [Nocardioides psychrotolerans]